MTSPVVLPAASLPVRVATAVLAGLAAAASFEPFGLPYLLPLAVAGLTLAVLGLRLRAALVLGTAFGFVFMLVLLPWLRVIGVDAWLGLSFLEAVFYGLIGVGTALVARLPWWPVWAAAVWVGAELLRSTVPFGGFPWGRLAFATVDTPVAASFAYVGAGGATFLVALLGTCLAWGVTRVRRTPVRAVATVVVAAVTAGVFALGDPGAVSGAGSGGRPFRVAAVQGNVPGEGMEAFAERRAVLDNHVTATLRLAAEVNRGARPRPDIVIWPESSTDIDPFADPSAYAQIQGAVNAIGVPVLVGAMVSATDPRRVYNQGIVWSPGTGPGERYAKRHPVPFGEYIPFRALLSKYIRRLDQIPRDMIAGSRPGVMHMNGVTIGDVICFEVAYDDVVREAVTPRTEALVVQTNNATYMGTGQVEQQFAIARLRALETGRTVIVAATNGVSGIIAPDGSVEQRAPVRTQTVLTQEVHPAAGTPMALRIGPWVERGLLTISLVAVLAALGVGYRRRPPHVPVEHSDRSASVGV